MQKELVTDYSLSILNLLILIFLQLDCVDLWYFKLWFLLNQIVKVWGIEGLHYQTRKINMWNIRFFRFFNKSLLSINLYLEKPGVQPGANLTQSNSSRTPESTTKKTIFITKPLQSDATFIRLDKYCLINAFTLMMLSILNV